MRPHEIIITRRARRMAMAALALAMLVGCVAGTGQCAIRYQTPDPIPTPTLIQGLPTDG